MSAGVVVTTDVALEVARDLARTGVPIFLAEPDGAGGFRHPRDWQTTEPDPGVLDRWRPGMAVCAVMGVVCDGVDVDPRHGGGEAAEALRALDAWPRSYGRALTPSGGTHDLIARLHTGSKDGVRDGVDLKGGRDDGTGRGFLYIAPSERISKVTGKPEPYRWEVIPDLDSITEDEGSDETETLAKIVTDARNREPARAASKINDAMSPRYDAMGATARRRVDGWVASALVGIRADLREAASWPSGHRDERGRGWEKLAADKALRLASLADAGWNDLTAEQARQALSDAAPTDTTWTARHVDQKWRDQSRRAMPAQWPSVLQPEPEVAEAPLVEQSKPITLTDAHAVFTRWLGQDYDLGALDAVIAAAAVEQLGGDPVWLLVVGGSGATKTETVAPLAGAGAHVTSTITSEGALLSATSRKETAKDASGGLLRKIGNRGVLVLKDFTSILSMGRDQRAAVLAALREVYDGRWERNVGTDGGRTLTWEGRIVLIGAVTTAYDTAHAVVAAMGDRFALVRVDSTTGRLTSGRQALRNVDHEIEMRADLAGALAGVLAGIDPAAATLDDDDEVRLLGAANLVTLARTAVEYDTQGKVIDAHAPEMPTRFAKMLGQIVRGGRAAGMDRASSLALAERIASDSVPPLRLDVLRFVLATPDCTLAEATKGLQKPRSTVDRALQSLHVLGLLRVEDAPQGERGWRYAVTDELDLDALRGLVTSCVTRNVTTPGVGVKKGGRESSGDQRLGADISGYGRPGGRTRETGETGKQHCDVCAVDATACSGGSCCWSCTHGTTSPTSPGLSTARQPLDRCEIHNQPIAPGAGCVGCALAAGTAP